MRWQDISEDSKEKYQLYLCSREWCERREAVRARADGICERCKRNPMDAVHHKTYARKYAEPLEDLQAICNPCHEFTHGKSDYDPCVSPAVDPPSDSHTLLDVDDGGFVKCPICGFNFISIYRVIVDQGHIVTVVDREAVTARGKPINPERRGSLVELCFGCENGHEFDIEFEFYKGNTSGTVSDIRNDDTTPSPSSLWRD